MAVCIECPSRPARTLFDECVTVHGPDYERGDMPVDPGPAAHPRARERYQRELAGHADLLRRQKALIVEPRSAPVFLCGEGLKSDPLCACGHTAEMLCDYPMGRGKTCDLPVCWCCSRHIADDRDLCLIHFAEFVGKSGAERINPWPPKKAER